MASALSLRAARILDDQDLLAALRHDAITAPCVIDGPISGETFTAYVEQFLVPILTRGDIVIMTISGPIRGPPSAPRSRFAAA